MIASGDFTITELQNIYIPGPRPLKYIYEGFARPQYLLENEWKIVQGLGTRRLNDRYSSMYDVIIVGAGPAALSAALILGRCRRRTLLCDSGVHRNAASRAMHGFLSRDGVDPMELVKIGRDQLAPYSTVEYRQIEVNDASRSEFGFQVTLADGTKMFGRKLLLATGVVDELPEISGIQNFMATASSIAPTAMAGNFVIAQLRYMAGASWVGVWPWS